MVAFAKLEPGMVLYDCHREKMGNTTMYALGVWEVRVVSVDRENRVAQCSWNGNPARRYSALQIAKLRASPPEWIYRPFDGTKCHFCYREKTEGHRDDCAHPAAVRARKKAAKDGAP